MLIAHAGKSPLIHSDAWVAPDATICGDVELGPGCRVLHGARLIGEGGGTIRVGRECIVMENAVVRAGPAHPCRIGDNCLIGPNAHVVGATLQSQVFIATGAAVFHGATVEKGGEVRIGAVVHLRSRLPAGTTVPIGWVAVGDPAEILPPDAHEAIWSRQQPLDFPGFVYGLERGTPDIMVAMTSSLSQRLGSHREDEEV